MTIDMLLIAAAAALPAFCIGHFVGVRSEAAYWRDHADDGSICSRGVFYRVTYENKARDIG